MPPVKVIVQHNRATREGHTMMTKAEFLATLRSLNVDTQETEGELSNFDRIADAASNARMKMPSIGLASVSGRLNCFIAVCRHLDSLIEDDEIDLGESQLVLMILRFRHKKFLKAITMFDLRANRLGARERAELPKSAREYLAGLQMYG